VLHQVLVIEPAVLLAEGDVALAGNGSEGVVEGHERDTVEESRDEETRSRVWRLELGVWSLGLESVEAEGQRL